MASLESLCKLAQSFPTFAQHSLDFVVDMFNDEIEDIRLKAIQCLSQISQQNIVLREDQVDIILFVLEDSSIDIREALHDTLGNCKLSTKEALKSCIDSLLDNLKKYPEDKHSIWSCFQKLGLNHPSLTLPLVTELLMIHPYLDLPESSLEDNSYISVLILVFNAASQCPAIISIFQNHTIKHYSYLRDSFPTLVPHVPGLDTSSDVRKFKLRSKDEVSELALKFLANIFERIKSVMSTQSINLTTQAAVIELSIK
jgi:integrator complex subunit, putative